jgi:hypothetical protein
MAEALRATAGKRARPRGIGWRAAAAAIGAALGIAAATPFAGCNGGQRFPVCKSNAECSERDAGAVCFNLKCVECRYDVDCKPGHACSAVNTCDQIADPSKPEPEDAGAVRWEESSWAECAEKCKDQACIKQCTDRFGNEK